MSRRLQENLIAGAFVALFIGIIVMSLDFGPRARMIPLPLAIFGIVLTLIQLVWHNFGSTAELRMDMISVHVPDAAAGEAPVAPTEKTPWWREFIAYGMIGILLVLIFVTGVIPAAFLFTAGYFLVTRYCSWWRSLLYAATLTASLYLLFVVALQMQPYHGLLAPLFP